jgi:hypothetical protein
VKEIGLLILGWLFGLLTGPIADAIARRRAVPTLGRAIKHGLDDVRMHCAMLAFSIRARYEEAGRKEVEDIVRQLDGLTDDAAIRNLERFRPLLERPDPELQAVVVSIWGRSDSPGRLVRRLEFPFLAVNLHRLDIFSDDTQQRLLRITGDARRANEIASEVDAYFNQTFDGTMSEKNHEAVRNNLISAQRLFATVASRIANSVLELNEVK